MSVVESLKIQIHVCGTYVLSGWFTLLIGFGSVWIFSRCVHKTPKFCLNVLWKDYWTNEKLYHGLPKVIDKIKARRAEG